MEIKAMAPSNMATATRTGGTTLIMNLTAILTDARATTTTQVQLASIHAKATLLQLRYPTGKGEATATVTTPESGGQMRNIEVN